MYFVIVIFIFYFLIVIINFYRVLGRVIIIMVVGVFGISVVFINIFILFSWLIYIFFRVDIFCFNNGFSLDSLKIEK